VVRPAASVKRSLALLALMAAAVAPGIADAASDPGAFATAVSAGSGHACALRADRTVRCWGDNSQGQLGDGTKTRRLSAIGVRGLGDVVAVSAGWAYTCAVVDDGGGSGPVKCWGAAGKSDSNGQITHSLLPVAVGGVTDAIAVSVGDHVACALTSERAVQCWGDNSRGALGDGTRHDRPAPVVVPGLSNVQAIDAGVESVCVVMQDGGTVRCWGSAGDYQVSVPDDTLSPTVVPGVAGATSVIAEQYGDCALISDGTARCWGDRASEILPPSGDGLTGATAFDWSDDGQQGAHSCVLHADGTVECRASSPFVGQLGNGTTKSNGNRLVTVSGLHDAIAISANSLYTCAVRSIGTVVCWGGGSALGNGTTAVRTKPVTVRGLTGSGAIPAPPPPPTWHSLAKRVRFPVYRPHHTLGLKPRLLLQPCFAHRHSIVASYGGPGPKGPHFGMYESSPDWCGNPGESQTVATVVIDGVRVPVRVFCDPVGPKCTTKDGYNHGFLVSLHKSGPRRTWVQMIGSHLTFHQFMRIARSFTRVR
jgi:hypothetical protein